ncbi:DUF6880 family protein [Phenylobacterium deserti]|uniref:Uncharacterized protein n=1 Tax=Phenylobacterium deserti TaxID=1914756 RepID=A0A328AQD3_9CAUL|nr:DUF6880 family protein [Phenylobacterium deserti]RAK57233.1 hypothetical protein DJ018_04600 [Phenylobacterium deserti]
MKRPTAASLKKVTPENVARLGAERLATILVEVAAARPELKRRLRMELAAEQGAEHLLVEIDRRMASLETSRSKVSWRQRHAFLRDLDALRGLIADRLAELDPAAANNRMLAFLGLAPRVRSRLKDRDGVLAALFARAAGDLAPLLRREAGEPVAASLAERIAADPAAWAEWLPAALDGAPPAFAEAVLRQAVAQGSSRPGMLRAIRALADAAGDLDAYCGTYSAAELKVQPVAAGLARRLLAQGRADAAAEVLRAAPTPKTRGASDPDPEWESAWIEVLEASGDTAGAQAARWTAFERTLSADRLRAFTSRLAGFDDVEAQEKAFDLARQDPDFLRGLRLLMEWPALPEAARMIEARADEAGIDAELAELWGGRLRSRFPAAAHRLLRRAAAAAFRRRDFATCDRLTAEADSIPI